ncbi:hypothetical protein J7394_20780 [Ruegeria sp. R13_0]|nr:hypothetical protein [Ruegeria sp. R13_0]
MFERYIEQGRFIKPFNEAFNAGRFYIAWPSDRHATEAMSEFAEWLTANGAINGSDYTGENRAN